MLAAILLAAVAATANAARNDNAIYLQTALSLGLASSPNASDAEPTACPIFQIPAGLPGAGSPTPFPWSVANASNPNPSPSFWLQENSCNFLVLPFEATLLSAFQVKYYAKLYMNGTNGVTTGDFVNFRYFCDATCSACAFNVNVTVGACNAATDRRWIPLGSGQDRNAIVRVQQYMTQAQLRGLIGANTLYLSGSPVTVTVQEQFYDKTCGGTNADPVLIRTGFTVEANSANNRSVDCVIGGVDTSKSYEVACDGATRQLKVLQHPGGKCSSFVDASGAAPSGTAPLQPATTVASGALFSSCLQTCGSSYNYLSTYAYCGGQTASLPKAENATTCPTPAPSTNSTTGGAATATATGTGSTSGAAALAAAASFVAALVLLAAF